MPYIEGHFDNECDDHSSEDHSGMNHQPVVMWCLSNYQHEMSHMVLVPPWQRGTPAVNSRLGVLRGLSFNSPCLHFRLFASLLFSQMSVPCLLPSLSWWQRCLCSIFRFRNVTATLCRYARICTDIHSFLSEWNVLSSISLACVFQIWQLSPISLFPLSYSFWRAISNTWTITTPHNLFPRFFNL